jgi:hypothetical protein
MASSNATMSSTMADDAMRMSRKPAFLEKLKHHRAIKDRFTNMPHIKHDRNTIISLLGDRCSAIETELEDQDLVLIDIPYPPCVRSLADLETYTHFRDDREHASPWTRTACKARGWRRCGPEGYLCWD